MSQADQILQYLMMVPGRKISTWIAYEKFRCTTICQRIPELRKRQPFELNGKRYRIADELVTRDGSTFSEYWLEEVKSEGSLF